MKKTLLVAVLAVLAVAGALWATDATWRFPVPTLAGLNAGDVIVAADANNLTNSSRIRLLAATAPTCTLYGECGTGYTITGNDSAGIITFGNVPHNAAFRLTFNAAWTSAPACTGQRQTGTVTDYVQKIETTSTVMYWTIVNSPATSDKFSYLCVGVA